MTLSAMVEIPLLQAHRNPVMPAEAGIQCGRWRAKDSKPQAWIPACAGKTEGEVDFYSTVPGLPGFEPKGLQLL
jgi:hypothetical protein